MDSSILDGEAMHVDRSAYASTTPRLGDVIVFEMTNSSGEPITLVKRVVGVGGDVVEYRGCQLVINGTVTGEPWIDPALVPPNSCGDEVAVTVPEGTVFVLGDNRGFSRDSRDFGPVDTTTILGRVVEVTSTDGVERSIET